MKNGPTKKTRRTSSTDSVSPRCYCVICATSERRVITSLRSWSDISLQNCYFRCIHNSCKYYSLAFFQQFPRRCPRLSHSFWSYRQTGRDDDGRRLFLCGWGVWVGYDACWTHKMVTWLDQCCTWSMEPFLTFVAGNPEKVVCLDCRD